MLYLGIFTLYLGTFLNIYVYKCKHAYKHIYKHIHAYNNNSWTKGNLSIWRGAGRGNWENLKRLKEREIVSKLQFHK